MLNMNQNGSWSNILIDKGLGFYYNFIIKIFIDKP